MKSKKKKSSLWSWIIILLVIIIGSIIIGVTSKGTTQEINWSTLDTWLKEDAPTLNPTDDTNWKNVTVYNNVNKTSIVTGYHWQEANLDDDDKTNDTAGWLKFVSHVQTDDISGDKATTYTIVVNPKTGETKDGYTLGKIWTSLPYSGSTWSAILASLIPLLLMVVVYGGLIYFMMKSSAGAGAGAGGIFGMGKNRARAEKSNVKFSDVAGIEEEKTELIELVDYLKNPTKYASAGARAPKGVLMEGPPGTGKTLLAKAVAGEANVSFFSIAGSEFEEMFVGVGASRVREMFNDAKKAAPAIIFIDEIDAVGRKRNGNIGGAGNEQTLNQLLVEMDGFGTNSGIIVMGATNRSDVLDPALLRPGRFDRVIQVSLPDIKERTAILELHAKGKKIDKSVDWYRVAERTPGFSGAQLENVLNEAAILMVREQKDIITIKEIDEAIDRVVGGPAKKSRAMTANDKDIVSYHESGHALIGLKLESASKVQKVTIIPRGNAGGYTIMTPKDETVFSSKKDLLATIAGYLGGRAAEEIKFGKDNITTGAHDDLDKATNIARRMVVQFGMSSLGMTKFLTMAEESYGRIEGTYSDETAARIDLEISKILEESYKIALKLINENMPTLELLAESLRVLETITAEQIDYINKHQQLPDEVIRQKQRMAKETESVIILEDKSKEKDKE